MSDCLTLVQDLLEDASWTNYDRAQPSRLIHAYYPKQKAKCTFIVADPTLDSILDVIRVADILLYVVYATLGMPDVQIFDQVKSPEPL